AFKPFVDIAESTRPTADCRTRQRGNEPAASTAATINATATALRFRPAFQPSGDFAAGICGADKRGFFRFIAFCRRHDEAREAGRATEPRTPLPGHPAKLRANARPW